MKITTRTRYALIIGNAAYRRTPLRNPLNDARAMVDGLKRTGFQVAVHLDAGRDEMRRRWASRPRQSGQKILQPHRDELVAYRQS